MNINRLIGIKPRERIEYMLRRHAVTFAPTLVMFAVLAAIPIVVYILSERLFPGIIIQQNWYALLVVMGTIYYLFLIIFFYTHFIDYYLALWIVTNDRIIDIEQQGIFSRVITELNLFQVEDVTTEIRGFMPTIFHYGEIKVKTASSNEDIIFHEVPYPNKVRERLLVLADENRKHPVPTAPAPKAT